MIKYIVLFFNLLFISALSNASKPKYIFKGEHYIADYRHCNTKFLSNPMHVFMSLYCSCVEAGAHILDWNTYTFSNGGCSICLLLKESHASIHTYPEFGACFVDLFTCGTSTDFEIFHESLTAYLGVDQPDYTLISRGTTELLE